MKEYKEFTCIVCGEKGIDKSSTGNKKFCSKECQHRYWDRKKNVKRDLEQSCFFNEEVACEERKCVSCGWNPAVAKMRKEAMLCPKATG